MQRDLTRSSDQIKQMFFNLKTPRDIAELLEISYETLVYLLYRRSRDSQYIQFSIPKKTGGERIITAPNSTLKILQRKLSTVFYTVYQQKPSAHGFCLNRNIVTNAQQHINKRFVINIDIEDFFGSITFRRVRGLFISKPYSLPPQVATVLAQICIAFDQLPQGAPTSPIVSNMLSARLDNELQRLARRIRCTYSRYADDISFSFSNNKPDGICRVINNEIILNDELELIIENNGFKINKKKTRIAGQLQKQMVTGITVNKFPNVNRKLLKQIRAMLYAWETFGPEAAEKKYLEKYNRKHRSPGRNNPSFINVVKGKINFVKMVRDPQGSPQNIIYRKLINKFNFLAKNGKPPIPLTWEDELGEALWIIENWEGKEFYQGSGFILKGVGLVTCSHVVFNNDETISKKLKAYKGTDPFKSYDIEVQKSDKHLDLAILKIKDLEDKNNNYFALNEGNDDNIKQGDLIITAGFVDYAQGNSPRVTHTSCINIKPKSGINYFLAKDPLYEGNSGGPALNEKKEVIGVVATGYESPLKNGIIPIKNLKRLLNQ